MALLWQPARGPALLAPLVFGVLVAPAATVRGVTSVADPYSRAKLRFERAFQAYKAAFKTPGIVKFLEDEIYMPAIQNLPLWGEGPLNAPDAVSFLKVVKTVTNMPEGVIGAKQELIDALGAAYEVMQGGPHAAPILEPLRHFSVASSIPLGAVTKGGGATERVFELALNAWDTADGTFKHTLDAWGGPINANGSTADAWPTDAVWQVRNKMKNEYEHVSPMSAGDLWWNECDKWWHLFDSYAFSKDKVELDTIPEGLQTFFMDDKKGAQAGLFSMDWDGQRRRRAWRAMGKAREAMLQAKLGVLLSAIGGTCRRFCEQAIGVASNAQNWVDYRAGMAGVMVAHSDALKSLTGKRAELDSFVTKANLASSDSFKTSLTRIWRDVDNALSMSELAGKYASAAWK